MLANAKKIFLDALFPRFCLNCGKEGTMLCADCFSLIEITCFVFCPFCSRPTRLFQGGLCPKHRSRHLKGLYFAASYRDKLVKNMITRFKYQPYLKTLAPTLASLIITHFIKTKNTMIFENGENSALVPIPLYKSKKRKRGFNQSEVIGRIVAAYFQVPFLDNVLFKIKKTAPQVGLSSQERADNLKNAFAIKNPAQIAGKKIFLIDDVFTTGATMEEAAKTLEAAKARSVWGIAVARETLDGN
ncbi:MAG: ComF family protein [Candidatus Pacebacteria bacterium]|nr:ComF family protein [Candidatus Paceibacterota bacterium]